MTDTRRTDFLRALSSRPLSDLAPLRRFRDGEVLGLQGERCDHICIVASGQVLLSRASSEPGGEESALYVLGPGDLFGEGSLHPSRSWLFSPRALETGSIHCIPAGHLPRIAQYYPDLISHIVSLMSVRLEWAHQRVELVKSAPARERLLALARHLAEAQGEPDGAGHWVSLSLTQAQLGSLVGLARETVVRCLADLETTGQLRREGRRGFWVASAQEESLAAK